MFSEGVYLSELSKHACFDTHVLNNSGTGQTFPEATLIKWCNAQSNRSLAKNPARFISSLCKSQLSNAAPVSISYACRLSLG